MFVVQCCKERHCNRGQGVGHRSFNCFKSDSLRIYKKLYATLLMSNNVLFRCFTVKQTNTKPSENNIVRSMLPHLYTSLSYRITCWCKRVSLLKYRPMSNSLQCLSLQQCTKNAQQLSWINAQTACNILTVFS